MSIEEKERDSAYRAIHGMTVTAKAISMAALMGDLKGLGEAQLYPENYDGRLRLTGTLTRQETEVDCLATC